MRRRTTSSIGLYICGQESFGIWWPRNKQYREVSAVGGVTTYVQAQKIEYALEAAKGGTATPKILVDFENELRHAARAEADVNVVEKFAKVIPGNEESAVVVITILFIAERSSDPWVLLPCTIFIAPLPLKLEGAPRIAKAEQLLTCLFSGRDNRIGVSRHDTSFERASTVFERVVDAARTGTQHCLGAIKFAQQLEHSVWTEDIVGVVQLNGSFVVTMLFVWCHLHAFPVALPVLEISGDGIARHRLEGPNDLSRLNIRVRATEFCKCFFEEQHP